MIDLQTIGVLASAASVVVGVAYNMYSLRIQTKNRQAQIYMSMWQKMTTSEWHDAANMWIPTMKVDDYEHYKALYSSSPQMEQGMSIMQEVFEGVGVFVHEGLIDIRLVAREIGGFFPRWWRRFGPFLLERRAELEFPRFMIEA